MNKISLEEIEDKLTQGIAEIMSLDHTTITAETSLADLGIDSLGLVEIFVFIEKNFNLMLMESGLTKKDIQTVHSLATYISGKI